MAKYQPCRPPIRWMGANARAGSASTLICCRSTSREPKRRPPQPGALSARRHRVAPARRGDLPILLVEGARNGLPNAQGTDREPRQGRPAADDRLVAEAADQLLPDAGVERGHKTQPQAGQPGGQERHRHHQAAHADLPRVFAHQLPVADPVGSADLKDGAVVPFDLQPVDQIRDHVLDGDGLRRGPHPARRDHHRQLVDQRPDQLERQRARPDDDGRPELHGGRAFGGQDVAHFLTAREVG